MGVEDVGKEKPGSKELRRLLYLAAHRTQCGLGLSEFQRGCSAEEEGKQSALEL